MATITSTGTFNVAEGAVASVSAAVTILPAVGVGSGRGRLIHPTLGTYDYARGPDQWMNVDGDAIIQPVWASTKTLRGAANTLFQGDLRDVIAEERWTQGIAMDLDQARMLVAMWQNPPDPSVATVQWWPSYSNELGFNVVILSLRVGPGEGINLDPLVKNGNGYVRGPVILRMRVVSRVEE